jgi:hypothetical protein
MEDQILRVTENMQFKVCVYLTERKLYQDEVDTEGTCRMHGADDIRIEINSRKP